MNTQALTKTEHKRLAELEDVVEKNLTGFARLAFALMEIRDSKLYRHEHKTFEEYCKTRWNVSRPQAYRLISGAQSLQLLSPMGDKNLPQPNNERQLRELGRLPEGERQAAWEEAVEAAGGELPTGAQVQEVVKRRQTRQTMTSSESVEWYSPPEIVEPARELMGGIDLDPASCEAANRIVKAGAILTSADDGLRHAWSGRVWFNPPYGREEDQSSRVAKWLRTLLTRYEESDVEVACGVVNAKLGDRWFQPLWNYPLCYPRKRVHFISGGDLKKKQPIQPSAIFYLGADVSRFVELYSPLGHCCVPRRLTSGAQDRYSEVR